MFTISNIMESTDYIAIGISLFAIFASICTFIRGNQTSRTSCKPYLNILYAFSDNDTSLVLRNVGMGSAIMTNVLFVNKKTGDISTNIVSLLSIDKSKFCEHKDFPQSDYGVYAAETLVLCRLRKSDFKNNDYNATVKQLKEDLGDICVTIEFKDIFNKKQRNKRNDFSYIKNL